MNTLLGWMGDTDYKLLTTGLDGYLEDSQMKNGRVRVGLSAEMTPYEHYLSVENLRPGMDLDWKSYWLSGFVNLKYDTFDEGYFPTRGIRLSLNGRYVFKGQSKNLNYLDDETGDWESFEAGSGQAAPTRSEEPEGSDPVVPDDYLAPKPVRPYGSILTCFEAAIPLGERFTILPTVYFGWNSMSDEYMHPQHGVTVGGFMPGRYTERQIPFFGFPNGFRSTSAYTVVPQLDLRYRFLRKNYVSARASAFVRDDIFADLLYVNWISAFGVEYARQSIVGPLRLAVQWCNITGITAYASIGFDF